MHGYTKALDLYTIIAFEPERSVYELPVVQQHLPKQPPTHEDKKRLTYAHKTRDSPPNHISV